MAMARHVEIDIDSDANTGGFLETAAAADRAASKVDELGDQMRGTARDAAALDVAILKTKAIVHQLGEEFARTRNEDVGKMLREQRGVLSSLQQIGQETDKIAFGSLFHGAAVDADLLNRKIRETKIAVDELGAAYTKTGDKDVLKSLREQRGTLQVLQQIRKGLDETAEAADKAGQKSERLGDKLRSTAAGAHTLEDRIEASKKAIIALGNEFVRTGDRDVFKNLGEERGMLRNLQQMRKEMELFGAGAKQAGRDFGDLGNVSGVISSAFKALPTEAKLALVGAAVAAAPGIVAAVSGALLAALSGGTMAVGILASLRSAEVQSAWKEFGSGALNSLTDAASSLQGPLIRAAGMFTQALNVDSLRQDFEVVAPLIEQLARGVIGLFQQFQPGFLEGLKGASVAFEALAGVLPELGHDLGRFFEILGSQGAGGASALEQTVRLLGVSLVALASIMASCSASFQLLGGSTLLLLDRLGALEPIVVGLTSSPLPLWLADLAKEGDEVSATWHSANEVTYEAAIAQGVFEQSLATGAQMAQQARQAVEDLTHQLSDMATQILNGKDVDLAFKSGRLDMIDALKAANGVFDENTKVGLAAEQSMVRQAQAAVAVRNAVLAQTQSVEAADASWDAHIQQIYADAAANGIAKEKVDAIIGALRDLPRPKPIDVELKRLGLTDLEISKIKTELDRTKGDYVANVITNHITRYYDDGRPLMGNSRYGRGDFAEGGIRHAAVGMIMPPRNPGWVLAGEPQTGGEALIPFRGISSRRAAQLAQTVLNGYGYDVVSRSGYGSPVMPAVGGDGATLKLDITLRDAGGQVMHRELVDYALRTGRTPAALFPDTR